MPKNHHKETARRERQLARRTKRQARQRAKTSTKTRFSTLPDPTVEAQVLATALSVYATTLSLGGTAGQAYGFTVTTTGLGADAYNVGGDGAAFGVASKTTLNVYELLKALDRQAVYGVLYNGDKTLRNETNDLFSALMQAGAIS